MIVKVKHDLRKIYLRICSCLIYLVVRNKRKLPKGAERILFICKGNVCRSPMAESVSKKMKEDRSFGNVKFYSRGLSVLKASPAEKGTILTCESKGVDLSRHRSRAVDNHILEKADLIFAMEYWQLRRLVKKYPGCKGKAFLLPLFFDKKFAGEKSVRIEDPYGGSTSDFEKCYSHLQQCVSNVLERIGSLERVESR